MTQLYDNITAFANKDSGAPTLANNYVVTAMIADAAVSQGKLKTTSGTISQGGGAALDQDLPGGEYGFYPTTRVSVGAQSGISGTVSYYLRVTQAPNNTSVDTGTSARIYGDIVSTGGSLNSTLYATQRYVQASPPYKPYRADDPVPLFVFVKIDKTTGAVLATYVAPDPPWANNGPTLINPLGRLRRWVRNRMSIALPYDTPAADAELAALYAYLSAPANRPEIAAEMERELTQAEKNADMALIPHPFAVVDAGQAVVVLNPTDDVAGRALLMRHEYMGDPISEMLHTGMYTIDNTPIPGFIAPASVMPVRARLKLTR